MQDRYQEDQVVKPTLKISKAFVKSTNYDCDVPEQQEMQLTRECTATPEKDENKYSRKRKWEWEEEDTVSKKYRVSKPLLHSLWAQFKSNEYVRRRDIKKLSFEFNLTCAQIRWWFQKNRRKFYKEMCVKPQHAQNK